LGSSRDLYLTSALVASCLQVLLTIMNKLLLLLLPVGALGHGAVSFPRPRQAFDGDLPPWSTWSWNGSNIYFDESGTNSAGACPIPAKDGTKGSIKANGQACFWFSNGCTIGCDQCDGSSNLCGHGDGKGHGDGHRFLYKGMTFQEAMDKGVAIPPWVPNPGDMVLDPKGPQPQLKRECDPLQTAKASGPKAKGNATICDPRLRTYNTQAECGSAADYYFYSPWRAPGSAPVIDACGSAGGRHPGQGIGGAGASFQNSSLFKLGDMGSKIPPGPSQATWKAGSNVEVGWTVMANHGGGYSYRLAPVDSDLSEATFQKMPLDFVGPSILRWDGDKTTEHAFDAFQVSEGTSPLGSTWRKNPIPPAPWEWPRKGASFEPVCEESAECKAAIYGENLVNGMCRCSGYSTGATPNRPQGPGQARTIALLPNLEIVDLVKIPADLKPGKYVLGWRYDCEETDQIWQSCSDITVTAAENDIIV